MNKKKLPYNLKDLTWDADHTKNAENTYCYCGQDISDDQPIIRCNTCRQWFHGEHIDCMIKPLLYGDTFGTFTCSICAQGEETFERKGLSWIAIVHLVIYNLIKKAKVQDAKKPAKERREHYFFRWKEDVCALIDDYWDYLVPEKQRSATWNNTIASVLSTHSNVFLSGFEQLHQSAWWTLHKVEPPTGEKKAKASTKQKPNLKKPLKRSKVDERPKKLPPAKKVKKEKVQEDLFSSMSELSSAGELSDEEVSAVNTTKSKKKKIDAVEVPSRPSNTLVKLVPQSPVTQAPAKLSSPPQPPTEPSVATPAAIQTLNKQTAHETPVKQEYKEIKPLTKKENHAPIPTATTTTLSSVKPNFLSPQDEWSLLQRLEHSSKRLPFSAARYKRKLAVRRLKRNLGIKLFDLDTQIVSLLRSSKQEPMSKTTYIQPATNQEPEQSQVDQQQLLEKITFTPYTSSFAYRLFGSLRQHNTLTREEPWLSSWNGRKLRPYIRRDYQSKSQRMLLMGQIQQSGGKPRTPCDGVIPGSSIDYVYFQKEHLAQVNSMLSRIFWEGIDVSESLLFPEFSIVALYKRRVIGCAFMTPEAYITYFAVDAGWENSSIGQFMLYHLFQTAISKDITLHVSANNNAMILYQKFGFKPEEFIVNFYDKYLPSDSVYSKNAFFLRLRR